MGQIESCVRSVASDFGLGADHTHGPGGGTLREPGEKMGHLQGQPRLAAVRGTRRPADAGYTCAATCAALSTCCTRALLWPKPEPNGKGSSGECGSV